MFDKLIEYYAVFLEHSGAVPQDADKVQAYGMRFNEEWRARADDICNLLSYPKEDFDYNKYRLLMPLIERAVNAD
jgi:hypothetical protein